MPYDKQGGKPFLTGLEKYPEQLFTIDDVRTVNHAIRTQNKESIVAALGDMLELVEINPYGSTYQRPISAISSILSSLPYPGNTNSSIINDRVLDSVVGRVKKGPERTPEDMFYCASYFRAPYVRAVVGKLIGIDIVASEILQTAQLDAQSQSELVEGLEHEDDIQVIAGAIILADKNTPLPKSGQPPFISV